MKRYLIALLLLSRAVLFTAYADSDPKLMKQAQDLYDRGMYERAKVLFEQADPQGTDPVAQGYSVLCSAQLHSRGCETLIREYDSKYPGSALSRRMHWVWAQYLFDCERYNAADSELSMVRAKDLSDMEKICYTYEVSYIAYQTGRYVKAKEGFLKVIADPSSDYYSPSVYALGYMAYASEEFAEAKDYFELVSQDVRFKDIAESYLLECHFLLKDYAYVEKYGDNIYMQAPKERKPHIARIISESLLISGDAQKAKTYFRISDADSENKSRGDYFYEGSLQYALGEWKGAINSFSMMRARTDSIGQIANYHMAYSYIKLKNKVAAMASFKDASRYNFSPEIREDAFFNYAKLAFDLNQDASAFRDYISTYGSGGKGDKIYSYMALASLFSYDYASAVEAYDQIDDLSPEMWSNYMKANYLRANQLIAQGAYKDAIPCLRAASFYTSKQDPFNQITRWWLAESYYRTEDYQQAERIFEELYNLSALDRRTEGQSLSYNLGYCYFKEGKYEQAAQWFDKYLSSNNPVFRKDAVERRGDCEFIARKYNEAASFYRTSVNEWGSDNDIYPYYQLGLSVGLAGKEKEKASILERVRKADPAAPFYADALYELGRSYVALKKEKDAIEIFTKLSSSIRDQEMVAKSYIELGMIYRNKKNYNQALEYYKMVVEVERTGKLYDDAMYAIEGIYTKKGDPDGYLAYVASLGESAGKSEQDKENIYYNSAEQLFASEQYGKALNAFLRYVETYPQGSHMSEAKFYIAESYRLTGNREKALEYYDSIMQNDASSSFAESATMQYASISYTLERYREAAAAYSRLLNMARIPENVPLAQIGRMRSAYRAKMYPEALQAALGVYADPTFTEQIRWEADYICAKSYLGTSDRQKAYEVFARLSTKPSTAEGAEASYFIIQDVYDRGDFDKVEELVFDFRDNSGDQSYWLARTWVVLADSYVERDMIDRARAVYQSILDHYTPLDSNDDVFEIVKARLELLNRI